MRSDDSHEDGAGPWPAFADLLAATTLLFLILFAAIAVPALRRRHAAEVALQGKRSTLGEIVRILTPKDTSIVRVREVGDYVRVLIPGYATFPLNQYEIWQLKPEGKEVLRALGDSIVKNPQLLKAIDQIQVVGHTSVEGGEEHNFRLSGDRAATVALFLIDSVGISPCKVTSLGRSRYYPPDPEAARAGRIDPSARRIELEIRPVIQADSEQVRRRRNCVDQPGRS